ncbi:MAG: hypothetical protein J5I93_05365 [Pirellulaceae bacterium]|nr:hypothetical protein [Pirellulaceae bacterium]
MRKPPLLPVVTGLRPVSQLGALLACLSVVLALAASTAAQETRTVTIGGVPYQETYQTVSRPVTRIDWQPRERTRTVQRPAGGVREWQRPVVVPRVTHEWHARRRFSWNPLAGPDVVYELLPRTVWERRLETVRQPVGPLEPVPERWIVDEPVRVLGFEQQRELVSRVPIQGPSAVQGPSGVLANQALPQPQPGTYSPSNAVRPEPPRIGGVQRYDDRYPRR